MSCQTEIIAHRGASHDAPENTVASVKLAWERAADAVEVDVRLSRDGAIVTMHDADLARTAGVEAEVENLTMAELKALDVGRWKGDEWSGERIPTLDEILALTPDGRRLMAEVKCGPEIIPALEGALQRRASVANRVVLAGFSDETMGAVKAAFPLNDVYLISRVESDDQTPPPAGHFIGRVRSAGLDGLSLAACDTITAGFVGEVRAAGLPLVVWTVDSASLARRMVEAGVNGIATNRPGWLRARLGCSGA